MLPEYQKSKRLWGYFYIPLDVCFKNKKGVVSVICTRMGEMTLCLRRCVKCVSWRMYSKIFEEVRSGYQVLLIPSYKIHEHDVSMNYIYGKNPLTNLGDKLR